MTVEISGGITRTVEVGEPDGTTTVVEVGVAGIRGQTGPAGPVDTSTADAFAAHLIDPTPHPAYDDIPDLTVIFENALL